MREIRTYGRKEKLQKENRRKRGKEGKLMPEARWYRLAVELSKLSDREFYEWMEKNSGYYLGGGKYVADYGSLFCDEYRRRGISAPKAL